MAINESLGTASVEIGADWSGLEKAIKDLEKTMKDVMDDISKIVKREMGDVEDSFKDGMDDSEKAVDRGMDDISDAFRSGIQDADRNVARGMGDVEDAFQNGMNDAERAVDRGMQDIENSMESGLGDMEKGIKGAMAGIAAAFATIGVASFDMASQFEKANGIIEVGLGLTGEAADEAKEKAQELWRKGFGQNIEEAAQKVVLAKQALSDLNDQDFDKVIMAAQGLEDKFGLDYASTIRTVDTLTENFGYTGEEAMDLIVKGMQMGLNKSDDFLDTLNEYSPYFKSIGMDGEDMLNILNAGLEAGAFNADKVADAVKEFNIRIKDGSDTSREAVKDLGLDYDKLSKDIAKGGDAGEAAFKAILIAISQIEDPVERNRIGVALLGTQYEDMESTVINAMANAGDSVEGLGGQTDHLVKTMESEHSGSWEDIWRRMQEAMLPVGQELMRLADEYMPAFEKAMVGIERVTTMLIEFNGALKNVGLDSFNLVLLGAVAGFLQFGKSGRDAMNVWKQLTAGSMLKRMGQFGGAFATVGNHSGRLSRILASIMRIGPALSGMFAALLSPVGLVVAAIAALTGVFAALWIKWDDVTNKTFEWIDVLALTFPAITVAVGAFKTFMQMFEEAIPSFDAFDLKVSESTAKTINDYMKMENDAVTSLWNMTWGVIPTTEEALTQLQGKFTTMADSIIQDFQKQKDKSLAILEEQLASSVLMTSQEKEEILKLVNDKYTQQIKTVEDGKKRINEILEAAKKEGREITQAEQNEIIAIKNKQRELAVQAATTSKEEQEMILQKLKESSSAITAQQAADVIKNSAKQRDETIKNAEKEKEERIKNAENQYFNLGSISKQQYEDLVADANKQYSESVYYAKLTHSEVVKEAEKQAGEHGKYIDTETGKVKTGWTLMWESIKENSGKIGGLIDELLGVYSTFKKEVLKVLGAMGGGWDDFAAQVSKSVETVRKAINKFIGKYNDMSLSVPTIDIPGVGKVGGFSWSPPDIPYLAKGGFATGPTLAMIGEGRHDEAVVPLSDKVFKKLADGINEKGGKGNGGVTQHITTTASASDIQRHTERAFRKLAWGL